MSTESAPETVQELNSTMTGRWLVTTGGSQHVWDLDTLTYTRIPGPGRGNSSYDGVPQRIWAVKAWPKLGSSFYVELDVSFRQIEWRLSTAVRRIERMADEGDPYDPTDFMDAEGWIWCRVTLTYPDGDTRSVRGGYLHPVDGFPKLQCGIFALAEDLCLPEPSDAKCLAVGEVVDRQLAQRPWAVVECPEFSATLMLEAPPWLLQ